MTDIDPREVPRRMDEAHARGYREGYRKGVAAERERLHIEIEGVTTYSSWYDPYVRRAEVLALLADPESTP